MRPFFVARVTEVVPPPQGVLLYGPPGTGKTLLAKAIASNMDANFLKVVSSAIVDKYIGESARLIREMFGYAKVVAISTSPRSPHTSMYLPSNLRHAICSSNVTIRGDDTAGMTQCFIKSRLTLVRGLTPA